MYSLPEILFLILVETKEPKGVATEINGLLVHLPSVDVSAAWLGPVLCWIASETDFLTKGRLVLCARGTDWPCIVEEVEGSSHSTCNLVDELFLRCCFR